MIGAGRIAGSRSDAMIPESEYFINGKLGSDQLADYGKRKNFAPSEVRKWLAPNI